MATYARGRSEIKVGILAIIASLVFLVLFAVLTDRGLAEHRSVVYIKLPSAEKLKKGDNLLFQGVPVGKVRALNFAPGGGVLVTARMRREVPLAKDATASLVGVGVFGDQVVVLNPGSSRAPRLVSGDTISGGIGSGLAERIEGLGQQAERLIGDSTISLVHGALAGTTDASLELQQLITGANVLLADQAVHLSRATAHAAELAGNLNRMSSGDELATTMHNLERTSATLVQVTENMSSASASLASILRKVDSGEGSAGRMVNDPALYERAFVVAGEMEKLVEDVRQNPRRYLSVRVF